MKEMAFEHKRMSWLSIGRKGEVRVTVTGFTRLQEFGTEYSTGRNIPDIFCCLLVKRRE